LGDVEFDHRHSSRPEGFFDAVSHETSDKHGAASSAKWRALSGCSRWVANAGYILLKEMYRLVRAWVHMAIIHTRAQPVCRLDLLVLPGLAAFLLGYFA